MILHRLRKLKLKGDSVTTRSVHRLSGAIEQDADVVIGIHNAEDDTNAKELHILKNRHGEVGTLRVKWQAAATRSEDELLTEMS